MTDLEVRKKIGIQWLTAAPVIEWIISGGNWYKKSKAKRTEGGAKNYERKTTKGPEFKK